ncbi:MAG TPA: threonine synthase [Pyrinomonadaceae bacterium]|nr:threonine synthase [Pyrinomonadaceae bacterium]
MHYFSTNRRSPGVTFREAVLRGQPDDEGLYFPSSLPAVSAEFLKSLHDRANGDIAFKVIQPFVGGCIPDDPLREICEETVDFDFPLVSITEDIWTLELFHGPTLAFKDVGARFMSRCLRYFAGDREKKTLVIVATSGDTGGAVAHGFHNVEGTEVVILYPKGRVSEVQKLQLTTLGGNVTTLEIRGSFDDCQAIAKRALADTDLQENAYITSANSINVARWLPQQFFYFFAIKQWLALGFTESPIFSVPSGNFGNLASGVLAMTSGLPVRRFIAACNANDVIPEFFRTGEYRRRASVATLSNAMDVGDPSNFVRILELFGGDAAELKKCISAVSISDERTVKTIRDVHCNYGYLLDPHGAVAFAALEDHLMKDQGRQGIFLETAHPVKFDSAAEILGVETEVPRSVSELFQKESSVIELGVDYGSVREIIMERTK